jgi:uncharacterized ferritin-like protein (DUF455 family)
MNTPAVLKVDAARARLMRYDTAEILTRLFFLERSLIISQAGWLPAVTDLATKGALARSLWEGAVTADALRNRVFELRYPSRLITPAAHGALIAVFDAARNAPGQEAFVLALAGVLLPALRRAYEQFSGLSDRLSDGPSALILKHALADKADVITALAHLADEMLAARPEARPAAEAWRDAIGSALKAQGPGLLEAASDHAHEPIIPDSQRFVLPVQPGRDARFRRVRFYWPHIIDPSFESSEGLALQMRSAIGHLNEVWAAEICAANLYNFADELGWDYIRDVARWTYDESRHCLMGLQRLLEWGFQPEELPLGNYLYVAALQQPPIYGLGMIFYLETKYIHRGRERIQAFQELADSLSRHDYEFDWADETFHAEYGNRWLTALFERRSEPPHDTTEIRQHCEQIAAEYIATATAQERIEIHDIAARLLDKARQTARALVV